MPADLRRQIAIVRQWLPLLLAVVVIAALAAYAVSSLQQKMYASRATLIVGQSLSLANPDYSQLLVSQRLSTTYAAVATTRPILQAVITELGLDVTPDGLAGRVQADAPADSTLLRITAEDPDPDRAAAIANAIGDKLISASPAIQGRQVQAQELIDSELAAIQEQLLATRARLETLTALADRSSAQNAEIQTLEDRLTRLRTTYAPLLSFSSSAAASLLTVIEPAAPNPGPVSPRTLLNVVIAVGLGVLVAVGIAFTAESLDDSIRDPDTVEQVTGLSTLGMIGRMSGDKGRHELYRLAPLTYPRSAAAEAYRTLRTNVEFASVDSVIRTLLVTSSVPGEGKTVTACNLAVVFAQAGHQVLLVDADLRKPGVHAVFGLQNERGLTSLLRGDEASVDRAAQSTEQSNLRVVTTGPLPPNPAELMGSQRMRAVVESLASGADLVVFDSAPLQTVTDSAILSSLVDGTVLVIDSKRSRRRAVRLARESLARAGANVLGAVLNRMSSRTQSHYGSYYGSYHEPQSTSEARAAAAEGQAGDRAG